MWSPPPVVTTAIVNLCPYLQEDLRFCLKSGLPGRMAEVAIGFTKASKPGPGEMPMVGSPWHFSFLPSGTGPTFQNSIWTKRTSGDFSQQGDCRQMTGQGGVASRLLMDQQLHGVTPWDCRLFPYCPHSPYPESPTRVEFQKHEENAEGSGGSLRGKLTVQAPHAR